MKFQVLVSTMHRKDFSIFSQMNLQSDAVYINQTDHDSSCETEYNGHRISWYNVNERGVGKSRNMAFEKSDADIVLFADDDMIYRDGFEADVLNVFEQNPDVDMVVFNLNSLNPDRPEYQIDRQKSLNRFNCMRYGACRFALRRDAYIKNHLHFSLLFGGGAKYHAGEDNLFITQCIQKRMKVIASPVLLGDVRQEETTWFTGYDERYFMDKGALFCAMFGRLAMFYLFLLEAKKGNYYKKSLFQRLKWELQGIKEYKESEK